jgi:hypothetical protein
MKPANFKIASLAICRWQHPAAAVTHSYFLLAEKSRMDKYLAVVANDRPQDNLYTNPFSRRERR